MTLRIKRIYDEPEATDGYRVLVDRLWPRGVGKERAALDDWAKDVAPSPQLRTWFGHQPNRFEEFAARYEAELADNPAVGEFRKRLQAHPTVTLLYAAHDPQINHVVVLKRFLED